MDETEARAPVEKRRPGRPKKQPVVEREPLREPTKYKMRAAPNWESVDPNASDSPDRLKIDPSLIPEGMSAMWVTDTVLGQGVPQHRSKFEQGGWTPIHQSDFDGQFNGMFMPRDAEGEINVEGLVLMMRPKELTARAEKADRRRAQEQVAIKEQALTGGDMPGVSLDARHQSATNTNRIRRSVERIEVPE
jgi:hypothetical protein